MCGRFTLTVPTYEILAQALGIEASAEQAALYRPRYNVAPSDAHWVLRMKSGVRELMQASWGLIPHWSKRADQAGRPINARAESIEQKPAFRDAFHTRRSVVVADGFFEWKKEGKERRPIWFTPRGGGLLLLAGLDAKWTDPATGLVRRTFAIVTTTANDVVAPVHDRMPVVLRPDTIDLWMDVSARFGGAPDVTDEVRALLRPAPPDEIVATPVSPRVNSVKNDDPGCVAPLDDRTAPVDVAAPVRRPVAVGETAPLFPDDVGAKPARRRATRA